MPITDNGKLYNTVWRLHCNALKRKYKLTIEYYSTLPPARHEKVHEKIKQQALEWLVDQSLDPEKGKVEIKFMGRVNPKRAYTEALKKNGDLQEKEPAPVLEPDGERLLQAKHHKQQNLSD
jgi:hypothetical protein